MIPRDMAKEERQRLMDNLTVGRLSNLEVYDRDGNPLGQLLARIVGTSYDPTGRTDLLPHLLRCEVEILLDLNQLRPPEPIAILTFDDPPNWWRRQWAKVRGANAD